MYAMPFASKKDYFYKHAIQNVPYFFVDVCFIINILYIVSH